MDEETLKVLKSIESLIKGSMGGGRLPAGQQGTSTSAMRAQAAATNATNSSVLSLSKNLKNLNVEVTTATGNFGKLNKQMGAFIATMAKAPGSSAPADSPQSRGFISKLKGIFGAKAPSVSGVFRTRPQDMDRPNAQAAKQIAGAQSVARGSSPGRREKGIEALDVISGKASKSLERVAETSGTVLFLKELGDAAKQLTGEYLNLARVGLGSGANLLELSKDALLAGMSVKEYTAVMKENATFAARAGGLKEYDRITSAANDQLARMGVFGAESKALQASLANSNTELGVAQGSLTSAISGQVSMFAQLQKSTNMTSQEFSAFMKNLAGTESVQKELLGVGVQSREARLGEIAQIASTGQRLGLTAEASAKLTQALLAQRGASVDDRFEAAAQIRQASAFAGMGAEGEEAARITMKGRSATTEETERAREIAGQLDTAQQSMYNQGGLGVQSVLDQQMKGLEGTTFGKLMDANRTATLAGQSGAVNAPDFGKPVNDFGVAVGKFGTLIDGFSRSILGDLTKGIAGGAAALFSGPLTAIFMKRFGMMGGAATEGGGTVRGVVDGAKGLAGRAGGFLSSLPGKAVQAGSGTIKGTANFFGDGFNTIVNGLETGYKTVSGAASSVGEGIMGLFKNGLGGALETSKAFMSGAGKGFLDGALNVGKGIFGATKMITGFFGPLAGTIDAVIEAFTGEISDVLNPSGGFFNRIGGIITSFFSAIPNAIFDIIGFIFGDDAVKGVRNGFDMFVAGVSGVVKSFLASIADFAGWFTKWLPDDSKLKQSLGAMSAGLRDSADENFKTYDYLSEHSDSTFKTMAAANDKTAKAADASTDKVQKAQVKFNDVASAGVQTNADIVASGNAILAQGAAAGAMVAAPQVQTPPTVGAATVNTDTPSAGTAVTPALSSPEMITLLTGILDTLKNGNTINQQQFDLLSQRRVAFNSDESTSRAIWGFAA